jgi:hypothetical protein
MTEFKPYKVQVLNGEKIEKLIVFNGLEDTYIFSEEEQEIENKSVSTVQIHKDDSIDQIKKKIVNELSCNYAELYLFCYKTRKINLLSAIMSSTKSIIDKKTFSQFIKNMDLDGINPDAVDIDVKGIKKQKEIYEYNYISSLGFNKEFPLSVKTSLGIEFKRNYNYLFSPNPFHCTDIFGFETDIYLNENKLLGNIDENIIYVCLAKDVFQYAADNSESFSKIYFPHLANERVFNLEDLETKQDELKQKTVDVMKEEYFSTYQAIDKLYEIYYNRESELNVKKGIDSFIISIMPSYNLVMPLDAIFKNIHCDREYPFMKYNPGRSIENLYRMYSISVSKTGKKLPFLSKKQIMHLARTTSNHKEISIYNDVHNIIINVETDGVINILGKFKNFKTIEEVETILKTAVNPLLDKINGYLFSSGYRISKINSLKDENIKIVNMNYEFSTVVSKKMNLKNTCIYSIFDVIESDVRKGAILRFKRVDNFEKMDALNAFIIDMYKKRNEPSDAYNALVNQYKIDLNQAKIIVATKLNEEIVVAGKNPGLTTTIKQEGNALNIRVNNLENIDYIESLGIYLDSIVRLAQGIVTTNVCSNVEEQRYEELSIVEKTVEKTFDINNLLNQEIQKLLGPVKEKEKEDEEEEEEEEKGEEEDEEVLGAFDFSEDEESEVEGNDSSGAEGNESSGGASDDESDDDDEGTVKSKRFFLKRLMKADPVLFKEVNKTNGKLERYTRACPSMQQPVVISDEEKTKIDENYRDSYINPIEYGSSKDKKNWYICPRYWCFKPGKNTSMTEDDIKNGKCGTTEAEQKKYVFEFNNKKDHIGQNGKYRYFNPSFITKLHSNKDLCLPCCYAEWDSKLHAKRRKQCLEGVVEDKNEKVVISNEIMGNNTSLLQGRWGYLQDSVKYFMQIKTKSEDEYIFLRFGVDQSIPKQSFISCLADVYGRLNREKTPSLINMKKIIAESIDLDSYVKFGNGSFVTLFSGNSVSNIEKHKDTKIYASLMLHDKKEQINMIVGSYENFCKYLLDETAEIDHTYLWDIVSTPNKKLFEKGLNVVIMQVVNNDITDKIDLICPASSYVKNRFDKTRHTLFLINTEHTYEPVYLVYKKDKMVFPTFSLSSKISNITNVINILDNTLNKYCTYNRKEPSEYYKVFERPMELSLLVKEIKDTNGYEIEKQVLNYQNRTIALVVKTPSDIRLFIPCEPSEQLDLDKYPIEFMDEPSLWYDYETTRDELFKLKKQNSKILCNPIIKVFEEEFVVGFLTETNQFIKLSEPEGNIIDDELFPLKEHNHILNNPKQIPSLISTTIEKTKTGDKTRTQIVRNITLESDFFTLFRATVKSLLENRENKLRVMSAIENGKLSYKDKLNTIVAILKTMTKDIVIYSNLKENILNQLSVISYTCDSKSYSGIFKNGCQLILPKRNLISSKDNSKIYLYRVADEILRFGRIRNYILNSNQFLNMGNTEFKINNNEYIILESVLTSKEYFEDTDAFKTTDYSSGIPYDMATNKTYLPIMVELNKQLPAPPVENLPLQQAPAQQSITECYTTLKYRAGKNTNYWVSEVFPDGTATTQIKFKDTLECSFGPLVYIMQKIHGETYELSRLKNMLKDAYSTIIENEPNFIEILKIMKKQGKKTLLGGITEKKQLMQKIVEPDYFFTTMDMWVFAQTYKIPVILFSSFNIMTDIPIVQHLPDTQYNYSWTVLGYNRGIDDNFFFFESSSETRDLHKIPQNVLIEKSFNVTQLGKLTESLVDVFNNNKIISLVDFLQMRK